MYSGGYLILNGTENRELVFGLIGIDPSRSLSPRIHTIAMEKAGIRGIYRTLPVREEDLANIVADLRNACISGINVTIPYKEKIIEFLDSLSEEAKCIGAVNTVAREDERIVGYNTDCPGFLKSLDDAGIQVNERRALVLGSGGAARAVCYGLLTRGVGSLTVASRNLKRAESIVGSDLYRRAGVILKALTLSDRALAEEVTEAELIINTTPLGSGSLPGRSPLPDTCSPSAGQAVIDIVYEPPTTPLLELAALCGATTMNGLRMLVHQALESLRIWLDVKVDAEYIINRL
ncbi:MAG: shikimate dehydrogenase family protein [Candidatus Glassbacteria bacterium]